MTAIETTNTSTCVAERKGHSQKTTADSPARYLMAVSMIPFVGPMSGSLPPWSLGRIRGEGTLSAAPHLAQKIRLHQRQSRIGRTSFARCFALCRPSPNIIPPAGSPILYG